MSNAEVVRRLATIAATADEAALFFGISGPTWVSRLRKYPALKASWDAGRAEVSISLRRNLFSRAARPTSSGLTAALFLAKRLGLFAHSDDGIIEKPPPEDARLQRLTPEERAELERIMQKASR